MWVHFWALWSVLLLCLSLLSRAPAVWITAALWPILVSGSVSPPASFFGAASVILDLLSFHAVSNHFAAIYWTACWDFDFDCVEPLKLGRITTSKYRVFQSFKTDDPPFTWFLIPLSVLQFSAYRSWTDLVRCVLKYFIFDAVPNDIVLNFKFQLFIAGLS